MEFFEAIGKQSFLNSVVSFTGGGGKSSSMYRAARELSSMGYKVLVTTSTMIYHPLVNGRPYDNLFTGSLEEFITAAERFSGESITVAASGTAESEGKIKLKGWDPGDIDRIAASGIFDAVLVEADGAKHLPIKAPGENEPVIPGSTAVTAGVIGLDALGKPAEEKTVFRLEYFLKAAKTVRGKLITKDTILNLVNAETGLFKNSPAGTERIVILNKADIEGRLEEGTQLAEFIMKNSSSISKVIVCSMKDDDPVKKVFVRTGV